MRRTYVYVAGPYTGEVADNVRKAILAADELFEAGLYPFCPHAMTHLWHTVCSHEYETWLDFDAAWLLRCDVVLRMPGLSKGAEREVALAHYLDIPVFYAIENVITWARERYSEN